jgi:formylglycine-generating enzyme required for sulfatase activity
MTRWALLAGAMACWCLATCSTAPAAPATSPATQPAGELTLDLGNKVTMKLALIPAGKFLMGSPADEQERFDDETQHEVTISRPFYMGVTEVTQEQYEAVMGNNPSRFKGDKNPVETVSWNDAMEFCKKLSARTNKTVRLPTEAQWEYACRAGTATPFHTGATISTDEANYDGNSTYGDGPKGEDRLKTIAVASFKPNAFGLYDTHGNVWEWCPDWHADYA